MRHELKVSVYTAEVALELPFPPFINTPTSDDINCNTPFTITCLALAKIDPLYLHYKAY